MPFFRDGTDQEWSIKITTGTLRRAKDCSAGAALLAATGPKQDTTALASDPLVMGETLWLLCEKQALERGYNPDSFADLFDGETLEKAVLAMLEAITDFSQPSVARSMNQKRAESIKLATAKTNEAIQEIDPKKLLNPQLASLRSALGLEEQSESTQAPGAIANS